MTFLPFLLNFLLQQYFYHYHWKLSKISHSIVDTKYSIHFQGESQIHILKNFKYYSVFSVQVTYKFQDEFSEIVNFLKARSNLIDWKLQEDRSSFILDSNMKFTFSRITIILSFISIYYFQIFCTLQNGRILVIPFCVWHLLLRFIDIVGLCFNTSKICLLN